MIKCPTCQAEHADNALSCDKCGSYLQGGNPTETDPMFVGASWMEREEPGEAGEEDIISPMGLRLTIPDNGHEVEVPLKKEVSIGRLDPASGSFPDVDLTSYGGLEKGISRYHAKITRHERGVFIEDLASINATFLNHRKLPPYLPQVLKSNDELQLGMLVLGISFVE
jgi:hypothetical protein